MLTKRIQVLLDEKTWNLLRQNSKNQEVSVGELIRQAIQKKYADINIAEERAKAFNTILKVRKISKGKIDYKELINYGRKY